MFCRRLVAGVRRFAALSPRPAAGQGAKAEPQQSITTGGEALSDGSYPWYDSETDSLKPMKFEDQRPKKRWNLGWLKGIVYAFLGLALAGIVARAGLVRAEVIAPRPQNGAAGQAPAMAADQVEALPFLAERPRGDLLGQARRHYEQGNYSEAIIYLFSYQLVELDKVSRIQLAKGKTNRQYLRELARVRRCARPWSERCRLSRVCSSAAGR